MAFRFKKKESVSRAVRRLSRSRVKKAAQQLKDSRRAGAIHQARKEIKKARTVIRLARRAIDPDISNRQNKLLRKAGRRLAPLRDAFIAISTFNRLSGRLKKRLTPAGWKSIQTGLQRAYGRKQHQFVQDHEARKADRALARSSKVLKRLELTEKGWKAIQPGIKKAYREGRETCLALGKNSAPKRLHEWRKLAKDLSYEMALLEPARPEQMDLVARDLESLGKLLGDDHDLFVLQRAIHNHCDDFIHRKSLEILDGFIAQRQRELRAVAIQLGKRFYAEKPSMFCDRLAGYWHSWRSKNNGSPRKT